MNIFVLDEDPKLCAEYHCNKHIVKMPLETAQLLSTAQRLLVGIKEQVMVPIHGRQYRSVAWYTLPSDVFEKHVIGRVLVEHTVYKPTHALHSCTVWLLESRANYEWTYELFVRLSEEYKRRYNKEHNSYKKLAKVLKHVPSALPAAPQTAFALVVPEDCKDVDAVKAYRNYYLRHKASIAKWTDKQPDWFTA